LPPPAGLLITISPCTGTTTVPGLSASQLKMQVFKDAGQVDPNVSKNVVSYEGTKILCNTGNYSPPRPSHPRTLQSLHIVTHSEDKKKSIIMLCYESSLFTSSSCPILE